MSLTTQEISSLILSRISVNPDGETQTVVDFVPGSKLFDIAEKILVVLAEAPGQAFEVINLLSFVIDKYKAENPDEFYSNPDFYHQFRIAWVFLYDINLIVLDQERFLKFNPNPDTYNPEFH